MSVDSIRFLRSWGLRAARIRTSFYFVALPPFLTLANFSMLISVAHERSMLERNRVIPHEVPRDFHVIYLTGVVKQSPIHWFGDLTRYVEVV